MASDFADPSTFFDDTVPIGGSQPFSQDLDPEPRVRREPVDISPDTFLKVTISDALSDKDRVFFTVRTQTNLPNFKASEFQVNRVHDEFIWLHDQFEEKEICAGLIVPPAPPRPDFDASRDKLQRLGKSEGTMTKQDMQRLKAELEAEYLANFKKTVAMHEVFVQRIANHPVLRNDYGFRVFLEYEDNLSVRNKNTKEKAAGFLRSVTKSADENLLLSNQRDDDQFFRDEKSYLVQFHNAVREAYVNADISCNRRRAVGECILRLELLFRDLSTTPPINIKPSEVALSSRLFQFFSALHPIEIRIASDEDLKLSDTLMYYTNESAAAKDLLYRRSRALANYQHANKALDKARAKRSGIAEADQEQVTAHKIFTDISEMARRELEDFKVRRIKYFQKNLISLAELQITHAKSNIALLQDTLASIKPVTFIKPAPRSAANQPQQCKVAPLVPTLP